MNKSTDVVAAVAFAMIVGLGITFLFAVILVWPAMIMFGIVHSYWAWLPAFGFWETLGVVVLARLVLPTASVNRGS